LQPVPLSGGSSHRWITVAGSTGAFVPMTKHATISADEFRAILDKFNGLIGLGSQKIS
jgi:hypothetical protein